MTANLNAAVVCVAIAATGCASTTRSLIAEVSLGMTAEKVSELLGEPVARARQEPYQAWRYEYIDYRLQRDDHCFSPNDDCRPVCEHTTIWLNDDVVRSMTSIRVDSLKECGSSSLPINWENMPDYARRPDS